MSSQHTIASYSVDLVARLGTDHVFSLTGGMAMHLNRAVAEHPGLKAIYCQHEQACVAAAEGYCKGTDFRNPGFAVVTAGPGVSNTVTSLISAYGDSTPVIVLAGQIKTADIDRFGTRTHGIQEIRSQEIISPCVKHFVRISFDGFRSELIYAISEALSGRPGPVFIEIPLNVQGAVIPDAEYDVNEVLEKIHSRVKSSARHGNLTEALNRLFEAKKPLLYVGNGVRIAGVEESVAKFIHQYKIPAVFSWLSFDILTADDPLNFGCPGGLAPISANEILEAADIILFLGARLDLGTTAFQRSDFGGQAERFIVDVDEYELKKFEGFSRTHVIHADLVTLPQSINDANIESSSDRNWVNWCRSRRSKYLEEEKSRLASNEISVYSIARVLSAHSPGKIFVPASSGYAEETFTRFFNPGRGTRFFNGAALGSMGLGLPHAIGAAFSSKRPVICLEADGGIMLNLQELATLSHYSPSGFVLFVLNNEGYESIRTSQKRHFGSVFGSDHETGVFIPNFQDIARSFKLSYRHIDKIEQLTEFMENWSPFDKPVLVNISIPRSEYRGPSVKTIFDPQGRPTTTPLAEISW
jgi:acetolactate synthase-1/2/3 large subunit